MYIPPLNIVKTLHEAKNTQNPNAYYGILNLHDNTLDIYNKGSCVMVISADWMWDTGRNMLDGTEEERQKMESGIYEHQLVLLEALMKDKMMKPEKASKLRPLLSVTEWPFAEQLILYEDAGLRHPNKYRNFDAYNEHVAELWEDTKASLLPPYNTVMQWWNARMLTGVGDA